MPVSRSEPGQPMQTIRPAFLPLACFVLLVAGKAASAQAGTLGADTLNQVDDQGRKQGWWRITAPVADKPGYGPGDLVEEGRYRNNRRAGTWKGYWPNGQLRSEITYAGGLPQGGYALYYENGKPEEQGTWDMDRNTGGFKRWYPNGNLAQEFRFDQDGVRNGEQKYYHENGRLAVDVTIKNGREEGLLKRFYANGDLQETVLFSGGEADAGSFVEYPGKQPAAGPLAADGPPAPPRSQEETTNSADFTAEGWNTLYDGQHRLAQQGDYRKGRLWNGKIYRYNKNGILVRVEVYLNGRFVGTAPLTPDDR